jgi:hypothetical protein
MFGEVGSEEELFRSEPRCGMEKYSSTLELVLHVSSVKAHPRSGPIVTSVLFLEVA